MIFKKIKNLLADWLLKERVQEFEEYKNSLTIRDLVFEKFKGFNPRALDDIRAMVDAQGNIDITANIFDDAKAAGLNEDQFLAENKRLFDNTALPVIVRYFVRNQTVMSFRAARSESENNFGRALVLGIELVHDEIKRLKVVYDDRERKPEEFDKSEVL